jgi:hypothetical protein
VTPNHAPVLLDAAEEPLDRRRTPLTLTKDALVPITVALALMGAAISATWFIAAICTRLDRIETAIKESSAEKISIDDFRLWALVLQRDNPTMKISEWPR